MSRLVERATSGDLQGAELLALEGGGRVRGVATWLRQGASGAHLWIGATDPEGPPDWARELPALMDAAEPRTLTLRLELGQHPELRGVLGARGWTLRGERTEYRVQVGTLPAEVGSGLVWASLRREGTGAAASLLARAAAADPLGPRGADPEQVLRDLVDAPGLWPGLEGMQLGRLEGVPAVLVGAQVDRRTGWSRVPYLAVEPSLRGRGLGRAGLRHGGALLRVRGGRVWEDGCAADNAVVRHLLDELGVTWVRRCEEWVAATAG